MISNDTEKYKQKLTRRKDILSCTVTKVANELLSWSLSGVDMSWGWLHVKFNLY